MQCTALKLDELYIPIFIGDTFYVSPRLSVSGYFQHYKCNMKDFVFFVCIRSGHLIIILSNHDHDSLFLQSIVPLRGSYSCWVSVSGVDNTSHQGRVGALPGRGGVNF